MVRVHVFGDPPVIDFSDGTTFAVEEHALSIGTGDEGKVTAIFSQGSWDWVEVVE